MPGVMKALYNSKFKVPDDISVIVFCEEPFSTMYYPQITSILPMAF